MFNRSFNELSLVGRLVEGLKMRQAFEQICSLATLV
jgi:hypothetical protein